MRRRADNSGTDYPCRRHGRRTMERRGRINGDAAGVTASSPGPSAQAALPPDASVRNHTGYSGCSPDRRQPVARDSAGTLPSFPGTLPGSATAARMSDTLARSTSRSTCRHLLRRERASYSPHQLTTISPATQQHQRGGGNPVNRRGGKRAWRLEKQHGLGSIRKMTRLARSTEQEKGDRHLLCEAPEGPFRQKVPVTFFRMPKGRPKNNFPVSLSGSGGLEWWSGGMPWYLRFLFGRLVVYSIIPTLHHSITPPFHQRTGNLLIARP